MAETTALLITLDAINGVEWADSAEGRDFDPDAVFDRLAPENRESFATFLRMMGSPVATFHDWVDLCWMGSPVRFPDPCPRPTHRGRFTPTAEEDAERLGYELCLAGEGTPDLLDGSRAPWISHALVAGWHRGNLERFDRECERRDRERPGSSVSIPEPTGPRPTHLGRFTPTAEMELEHLGYTLGNAGEDARPSAGLTFPELASFFKGWLAGKADLEAESIAEYHAWLDEVAAEHDRQEDAFGGPEATWHPAELAEARSFAGHPAFEG